MGTIQGNQERCFLSSVREPEGIRIGRSPILKVPIVVPRHGDSESGLIREMIPYGDAVGCFLNTKRSFVQGLGRGGFTEADGNHGGLGTPSVCEGGLSDAPVEILSYRIGQLTLVDLGSVFSAYQTSSWVPYAVAG